MNSISASVMPPSRTTASRLITSHYYNPAQSWPPSVSPNSHDYCIQAHTIPAFKSISKHPRLRPLSLHNYTLQVHLQTHSIMVSKCISTLTQSQTPSASPNLIDYSLQVGTITASKCIAKLAQIRPPSSHNRSLQVHLHLLSITASDCVSEFTWSQCGAMVELEGRQPIISTLPHHA